MHQVRLSLVAVAAAVALDMMDMLAVVAAVLEGVLEEAVRDRQPR